MAGWTLRQIAAIAAGWREEVRKFRAYDVEAERAFKEQQRKTRAFADDLERKAKRLESDIGRLRRKGLTDDAVVQVPEGTMG